jgi:hypothetical protein
LIQKGLFIHFHENNIFYLHLMDFNGEGEYHAVLIRLWKQQIEKDDNFGSGIGTAQVDYDADQKNRSAFADSKFYPFSTSDGKNAYHCAHCALLLPPYILRLWYKRSAAQECR